VGGGGFISLSAFGYDQAGGGPLSSDALVSDPAALTALFHNQQDPGWEFTDFIFFDIQPGETGTSDFAVGTMDRFSASAQSVPEPGTLSLLTLGLLTVFGLRRRHQR
jgi:PEP-CTERM motif-containing protein